MTEKINLMMSDCKITSGDIILETLGVGSCVVICIYHKKKKMGGMAHIMLSHRIKEGISSFRFADETIEIILKELNRKGCANSELVAKIVGGASMFESLSSNIGGKNVETVRAELNKAGIKIVAEDVLGKNGRSIWFDLNDGGVVVSTAYGITKEI